MHFPSQLSRDEHLPTFCDGGFHMMKLSCASMSCKAGLGQGCARNKLTVRRPVPPTAVWLGCHVTARPKTPGQVAHASHAPRKTRGDLTLATLPRAKYPPSKVQRITLRYSLDCHQPKNLTDQEPLWAGTTRSPPKRIGLLVVPLVFHQRRSYWDWVTIGYKTRQAVHRCLADSPFLPST